MLSGGANNRKSNTYPQNAVNFANKLKTPNDMFAMYFSSVRAATRTDGSLDLSVFKRLTLDDDEDPPNQVNVVEKIKGQKMTKLTISAIQRACVRRKPMFWSTIAKKSARNANVIILKIAKNHKNCLTKRYIELIINSFFSRALPSARYALDGKIWFVVNLGLTRTPRKPEAEML